MEGTQAPSPFEVLWDRYRSLILTIVGAVIVALLVNFGYGYYKQQGIDNDWTSFAVSLGMNNTYVESDQASDTLVECLDDIELASLEQSLAGAKEGQKPYYLLAIARKAIIESNWDRATKALDELEAGYPKHNLVRESTEPVQSREQKKPDEDAPPSARRKIEWDPAKAGSAVSLIREQIAAARAFQMPARFAQKEIPDDAARVKFTMGDWGSFTVVVMDQAPDHKEKFLELAAENHWVDVAVDEIRRGVEAFEQPQTLHLGYQSTKDDDRTKWITTEPSEHIVDFEESGLSHFAGAVAARPEAEGKSCADRFWICVDDAPNYDEGRVVFGYVVEGLDVLRSICDATMSAQEEERGQGRPTGNIRVTAVEVLGR